MLPAQFIDSLPGKRLEPFSDQHVLPGIALTVDYLEAFEEKGQFFEKIHRGQSLILVVIKGMGPYGGDVVFCCVIEKAIDITPDPVQFFFL